MCKESRQYGAECVGKVYIMPQIWLAVGANRLIYREGLVGIGIADAQKLFLMSTS
jgi:hypothetical protein